MYSCGQTVIFLWWDYIIWNNQSIFKVYIIRIHDKSCPAISPSIVWQGHMTWRKMLSSVGLPVKLAPEQVPQMTWTMMLSCFLLLFCNLAFLCSGASLVFAVAFKNLLVFYFCCCLASLERFKPIFLSFLPKASYLKNYIMQTGYEENILLEQFFNLPSTEGEFC